MRQQWLLEAVVAKFNFISEDIEKKK